MADTIIISTVPCSLCFRPSRVEVSTSGWSRWKHEGALIQEAFPELSADERELIMTGTHPECWDKMFPNED